MADLKQLEFGQRLRSIERQHRKLASGFVTSVTEDGLLIAQPRKKSSATPLRGLFLAMFILLAFKAYLYGQLGPATYNDRVVMLEQGTVLERIGAYAMKADPVTVWISVIFQEVRE